MQKVSKKIWKSSKVIGKIRWQFSWWYRAGVFGVTHFLTFLQLMMQIIIRPNERAQKLLRIHHFKLFQIRRSLHLIFRFAVTAIMIPSWYYATNTHICSRHIFDGEWLRRSFKYVIGVEWNSASIDVIKKYASSLGQKRHMMPKAKNGVFLSFDGIPKNPD